MKVYHKKLFLCLLFFLVLTWFLYASLWERRGFNVTPAIANASIHQKFKIPLAATNISYKSTTSYSIVNFNINEVDFRIWIESKNLGVTKIDETNTGALVEIEHNYNELLRPVDTGYIIIDKNNCGFFGVYDSSKKECSVWYTCK